MKTRFKHLQKGNLKFVLIGIASSIIIFFLFGIPTDVIPNDFYVRMIPSNVLDLFFLIAISLLLGTYVGLFYYLRSRKKEQGGAPAYSGAAAGIVALACPVCIPFLVFLFGATALMAYLQPLRPVLGFLSIGLVTYGIYRQIQIVKKCKACK